MQKTSKFKARLTLLLLFAVGIAPLAAAWIWYANADDWRPSTTVNYGTLIQPPRSIKSPPLPLYGAAGSLAENWFQQQWSLVYAGAANCPEQCKKALYLTRQIRLALGEDLNRVQRLFILPATNVPHGEALQRAHPDLTIVEAPGPAGKRFLAQFTAGKSIGKRIYLVDPRGRLMMAWPVDGDARRIIDDLERLLRYSQLG